MKYKDPKLYFFIQVLIFEPTHPRKNITLSITGVSDVIFKTKNYLIKKLDSVDFNFDKFQNQTNYQMIKFLLKFIQNAFIAD